MPPTDLPVQKDKEDPAKYDRDECIAALKGKRVPSDLTPFWHRRAVIRGIRNSLQFATSPEVIELCSGEDSNQAHQFSRARNARLIMSNIIPDMQVPATQPYCIWYPDLASEETYRELARQYPSMRYQVGRACAAAFDTDLYKELDILPDILIAEESRDAKALQDEKAACEAAWISDAEAARYAEEYRNADKDAAIYKIIMSAPQKWAVMDDFTRTVNTQNPQTPAFLNGNLKLRRALDERVLPPKNLPDTTADDIDIEEDGFIGYPNPRNIHPWSPESFVKPVTEMGPGDSEHLWMPLPFDIPNIDKRLITQMAAWEGNVDKYARLMHPRRLRTEIEYGCILRGIYHHTSFARWWEYQLENNPGRIILPGKLIGADNKHECRQIRMAINARKIMNNDISEIEDESDCLPWLIWWPVRPRDNTLYELAAKCPSMRDQIAITSILCDYSHLFRCLKPPPRESFYEAAKQSRNPYYLKYFNEFIRERSMRSDEVLQFNNCDTDVERSLQPDLEPRDHDIHSSVHFYDMDLPYGHCLYDEEGSDGIYGGQPVDAGAVERYMWLSTEAAQKVADECQDTRGVYTGSSDIGWLYIDDNPDSELEQRLSRRLKPMTSFEMENPEY